MSVSRQKRFLEDNQASCSSIKKIARDAAGVSGHDCAAASISTDIGIAACSPAPNSSDNVMKIASSSPHPIVTTDRPITRMSAPYTAGTKNGFRQTWMGAGRFESLTLAAAAHGLPAVAGCSWPHATSNNSPAAAAASPILQPNAEVRASAPGDAGRRALTVWPQLLPQLRGSRPARNLAVTVSLDNLLSVYDVELIPPSSAGATALPSAAVTVAAAECPPDIAAGQQGAVFGAHSPCGGGGGGTAAHLGPGTYVTTDAGGPTGKLLRPSSASLRRSTELPDPNSSREGERTANVSGVDVNGAAQAWAGAGAGSCAGAVEPRRSSFAFSSSSSSPSYPCSHASTAGGVVPDEPCELLGGRLNVRYAAATYEDPRRAAAAAAAPAAAAAAAGGGATPAGQGLAEDGAAAVQAWVSTARVAKADAGDHSPFAFSARDPTPPPPPPATLPTPLQPAAPQLPAAAQAVLSRRWNTDGGSSRYSDIGPAPPPQPPPPPAGHVAPGPSHPRDCGPPAVGAQSDVADCRDGDFDRVLAWLGQDAMEGEEELEGVEYSLFGVATAPSSWVPAPAPTEFRCHDPAADGSRRPHPASVDGCDLDLDPDPAVLEGLMRRDADDLQRLSTYREGPELYPLQMEAICDRFGW